MIYFELMDGDTVLAGSKSNIVQIIEGLIVLVILQINDNFSLKDYINF